MGKIKKFERLSGLKDAKSDSFLATQRLNSGWCLGGLTFFVTFLTPQGTSEIIPVRNSKIF